MLKEDFKVVEMCTLNLHAVLSKSTQENTLYDPYLCKWGQ